MAKRRNLSTGIMSNTSSSTSEFPSRCKREHLVNLSDTVLCQRITQMRTSRAYEGQSAEQQLVLLESNPCFQELRRRQRYQKRQRRVGYQGQRPRCAKKATLEHQCTYWWCRDIFDHSADFAMHMQMHEDESEASDPEQVGNGVHPSSFSKSKSRPNEIPPVKCHYDTANTKTFDALIRDLRYGTGPKEKSCTVECSSSDEHSVSDAPVYRCHAYRCGESFTDRAEFSNHRKVHDDETSDEPTRKSDDEWYSPIPETLSLTQRVRDVRRRHDARIAGIVPGNGFECPHGWCGTLFSSTDALRNHVSTEHTREGYISHLKYESCVLRALREWGLTVATSVEMYVSMHGWVSDTTRQFARVDMVVMDVTSCILLLEVDENAHRRSRYPLVCELSRQADVNAYLRLKGYMQPIYWLRFNPNSRYFVGDEKRSTPLEVRLNALRACIFSMMEPSFVPRGNVNVVYMFYSRVSESGPPVILESEDYPEVAKSFVSWRE